MSINPIPFSPQPNPEPSEEKIDTPPQPEDSDLQKILSALSQTLTSLNSLPETERRDIQQAISTLFPTILGNEEQLIGDNSNTELKQKQIASLQEKVLKQFLQDPTNISLLEQADHNLSGLFPEESEYLKTIVSNYWNLVRGAEHPFLIHDKTQKKIDAFFEDLQSNIANLINSESLLQDKLNALNDLETDAYTFFLKNKEETSSGEEKTIFAYCFFQCKILLSSFIKRSKKQYLEKTALELEKKIETASSLRRKTFDQQLSYHQTALYGFQIELENEISGPEPHPPLDIFFNKIEHHEAKIEIIKKRIGQLDQEIQNFYGNPQEIRELIPQESEYDRATFSQSFEESEIMSENLTVDYFIDKLKKRIIKKIDLFSQIIFKNM